MIFGIYSKKFMTMFLTWLVIISNSIYCILTSEINNCLFNSMCSCSADQNDSERRSIHSISCLSAPFYKFPNVPEGQINQLEVIDSKISSLETDSLNGLELQAFVFSNNQLKHISDRIFSSSLKILTSLDLSYNFLDSVPFAALKELKGLQWLNLHKNQISSINGDWSHMKTSLTTLFVGENDVTEMADTSSSMPHQAHTGLRQLKALIWLNLDGNRIHKIHKHSLSSTLQTVSVSHNLIENFPLDIISTIPRLQWLYLRGNQIRTIPDHTFSRKLWIQKIDLSENFLKTLPSTPFNNSIYIRDLNLATNDFTVVTSMSFAGLECRRIILSYNQIERLTDDAFHGIVETLEYLDLDHNRLKSIPMALMQLTALKYLYLSFNSFNEIPADAFDSFRDSLKALSLSGNRLNKIPSDALRNCTKITYFNIGFNQIYELDRADFIDWGAYIRTLILNNNRITNLNSKIFIELKDLQELSLSFNPLRFIQSDTFDSLDKLENLELSFSLDRDDLPYETFKSLEKLQVLSLDHNNFHEIKPDAFDTLTELTYLNLESNKIELLPSNLFKSGNHSKLKNCRLSSNELDYIETGTFQSLDSLVEVSIADNKIRHLETESFVNLPRLDKIILSNNLINRISPQTFSNLFQLKTLEMDFNQLNEISFKYFSNLSVPLHLNFSFNQIVSCTSDDNFLKINVLDLRHNRLSKVPECLQRTGLMKKLYLDYNAISGLEYNAFQQLSHLEHLGLHRNNIAAIDKKAFAGLNSLQFLDLSVNAISHLQNGQFVTTPKLKVLNLSKNGLNYLPRDVFRNTLLEFIDLSSNSFSVVPSLSLSPVGTTLRHLAMESNNLEHIDMTTFPDIPYLHHLDLSRNKLTILPDNVFTSLSMLHHLDLSSNPLRANFKELFHYAQNLKHLNLADTGIIAAPHFPLPNLVYLNLSFNTIEAINKNSMQELSKLKYLDLSHCGLSHIPSHIWTHLSGLKYLDLSYNKIKEITVESFHGLKSLQILKIYYLKLLTKFESKALIQLRILAELHIQTWPSVDHFYDEFCYLLSHTSQLRTIKLNIIEHQLDNQLSCLTNRKISRLEITGRNLRTIEKDAFVRFVKNPSLTIKISGTQIAELPAGLFANMDKIQYLTIDLSNNMLSSLTSETFYGNFTTWDDIGTTLISGGLHLSGNRFRCGCHLAWLGHWLRRWTRESIQAHNVPVEISLKVYRIAKEATCWDSATEQHVPIVKLPPVDMSCQASALSSKGSSSSMTFQWRTVIVRVLFVTILIHSNYYY